MQQKQQIKKAMGQSGTAFPRAVRYRAMRLSPGGRFRETAETDALFPWTERHLQCVWFDEAWRSSGLRSSAGEEIRVESPGRWNLESGPDFLDAELVVGPGRRRIRGDVEVHIHARDWQAHGHDRDPAYRRVAAHITYFERPASTAQFPPGTLQIALAPALKANRSFSFEGIDLAAYPHAHLPSTPTACREALSTASPSEQAAFLESAGEERLRLKAVRMEAAIRENGASQVLYEEILCALGYKHNRNPFRKLATLLPLEALRERSGKDPVQAYAVLLGLAGLMPAQTSAAWDTETRRFVRSLWDLWWKVKATLEPLCLSRRDWRLSGIRPVNHPARRLAAAAALFFGPTKLENLLPSLAAGQADAVFKKMETVLERNSMDYWSRRMSLGGKLQPGAVALLGSGRAAAILSNGVVPWLAATGTVITPLLSFLPPEEDSSPVRQTAAAMLGRDHNPALYQTGLRQQGLLQVFHDYCLNDRTGCRACPLASALKEEYGSPA